MAWHGQHKGIAEKRRKLSARARCWRHLDHNGPWAGVGVPHSPAADVAPPAERRDLPSRRHTEGTWETCWGPQRGNGSASHRDAPAGTGRRKKRRPYGHRVERSCPQHSTRKRADFRWVSRHENTWRTDSGGKAHDGSTGCWCGLPRAGGLAPEHLARCLSERASAPGPYRAGNAGWDDGARSTPGNISSPTRSAASALPIKRVTENHGNRTPGVDGETWSTPAKKAMAHSALRRRGYRPRPLATRVYSQKQRQETSFGHADDA